jgi:hypothetical protein
MAEPYASLLPPPSPEHRRIAAGQFEHANQVLATRRNYTYGIHLLLSCCKLDPANLLYRQALRRTQKAKYNNNLRGSRLAWLFTWPARARVRAAARARDYLKVLEQGEQVLTRNPWHVPIQLEMAAAADALDLIDVAVWILEQGRQTQPLDLTLNRNLAQLYERRGNFIQASALWELVRKTDPEDAEAPLRLKELAASETIVRGQYETVANGAHVEDQPQADRSMRAGADDPAALRARIEADPTSVAAYLDLATVLRRTGALEEGHALLSRGLGPTGNAFDLVVELADLEIEPFRRNLAITEEKLEGHPEDDELLRLRVRLRKEINTRELDLQRRKADRYPAVMAHRLELGIRLLRAGQTEEAINELQMARDDLRQRWQASYYLALAYKGRNWPLAQRTFEEALRELPPAEKELRKDLLFQLAQGAAQAGDLHRAVAMGRELAGQDESFRDIGRLIHEWQSRLQHAG